MPLRVKLPLALSVLAMASLACNTVTSMMGDLFEAPAVDSVPSPSSLQATPSPAVSFIAPPNPDPGPVGRGDNYFPELGNGGYDVSHYDIVLFVDVAANYIQGHADLALVAEQRLTSLNLELSDLKIDEILVNGEPAVHSRMGVELTIYLPQPAEAGDALLLRIAYQGWPGENRQALPQYSQGWIQYAGGVAVAGEPVGASTWYPVNEHPADKATYSYSITVDSTYQVAANGLLLGSETAGGETTYHWAIGDPIAPYLTTLAIAEFDVEESLGPNGLPIRNYFGKGVSQTVRDDFARTAEILAYFETVFGPYPFEAYGVVVHDTPLNFALETATLSVFGNSFTDEFVVVHEIAHHWFGNAVGLEQWQDIWLNEGFAMYASELWNEEVYGRDFMEESIRSTYQSLAAYAPFMESRTADPGPEWLFDYASVYARGGLVLHALRLELGDAAFFEALQTYVQRFSGGTASTADFIEVCEEVAGRALDDFFNAWLYELALPDIPQMGLYAADYQE